LRNFLRRSGRAGLPRWSPSVKLGNGSWRGIGHGEELPVVYLVRHAHAGSKRNWQGLDQARPLSAQGRGEALGLIEQLRGRPVGRLLSGPAERCLRTVEPLAGRTGHPVEASEALGVDGTGPGVLELLTAPALKDAVLCTHGEVIGKVFDELQAAGIELTDPPRWPKGSTWVLELDGRRSWKGSYLEPVVVEAAAQEPLPR
jgi:broad specificity phosphatase PhoE